jgi:signal transduction histidine kinase
MPPEASRIEFRFSSLTYSSSGNIRIAYRLADLDRNPIQLRAGVHTAFYDRLPKGTYTLEVWGMDENGHTTGPSTIYTVVKRPRWFETWTAYTAYAVMFLVLCICGFRLYAKHLRKKNAQLLREEIARTKLEYFTNVSHELLTPLTVLSCLTDEIEQNSPSGSPITRGLRDNILRLKKLIRQVLDFRKAEQKSLSLQASYGDVAAFIRHIAQTDFTLLARKKEIDFNLDIFPEDIYGFYDADKLEEMVFNLLSNAVKYTP